MRHQHFLFFILSLQLIAGCRYTDEKSGTSKHYNQSIPFDFPDLQPPVFPDKPFNVLEYGAKPNDSLFLNTEAIRNAIKACHLGGGGKVIIPEGIWMTGPVHLKSNVNLHLEEGAELRFTQKFEEYLPVVLIQRGGYFCYTYSPPLYARDCENIAVTGSGILNGQGQAWWPWKQNQPGMEQLFQMGKEGIPFEERVFGTVEAGVRPPFIQFLECKNVYIQGVTVKDGPSWNVHPVFCENLIIKGIKVLAMGPNNDGINPDGCKNVLIEDCYLDTGDDAITLKAGRDEEAWKLNRPLENVVIRNCTVKRGGGGFVIGSEMSAGVKNVLVEDCYYEGTNRGLNFKSRAGRGGIVENVWARNISMRNIRMEAIRFTLHYDGHIEQVMKAMGRETELVNLPTFRNIYIEDVQCENSGTAISIIGLPGNYLRELYFKNINIKAKSGLISAEVNDVFFENVNIVAYN